MADNDLIQPNNIDFNGQDFLAKILNDELNNNFQADSPYSNSVFDCKCVNENTFSQLNSSNTDFKILSLNIQSLPAKFTNFSLFISNLIAKNCSPDIICLQELWQFPDSISFSLPGYKPLVYKLRSNKIQGGGVSIFVKTGYSFSIRNEFSVFHDRIFESIFIELSISNAKKFIIGSCYRPNILPYLTGGEQFQSFLDLFSNLCNSLPSSDTFILGDFNVNLLQYPNVCSVSDFVDLLFSYGFLQNILFPTRVSPVSSSLQ